MSQEDPLKKYITQCNTVCFFFRIYTVILMIEGVLFGLFVLAMLCDQVCTCTLPYYEQLLLQTLLLNKLCWFPSPLL